MVDIGKAVADYEAGVKDIGGASAYYACGDRGGWADVAECLHALKKAKTEADWKAKYERKAH